MTWVPRDFTEKDNQPLSALHGTDFKVQESLMSLRFSQGTSSGSAAACSELTRWRIESSRWGIESSRWGIGSSRSGIELARWGIESSRWGIDHHQTTPCSTVDASPPPRLSPSTQNSQQHLLSSSRPASSTRGVARQAPSCGVSVKTCQTSDFSNDDERHRKQIKAVSENIKECKFSDFGRPGMNWNMDLKLSTKKGITPYLTTGQMLLESQTDNQNKIRCAATREELELGSPVGLGQDEPCETDLDLFSIDPEICTDTRTARSTIDLTSDTCGSAIDLTSDTTGSAIDLTSDTSGSALDLKSDTSRSAFDLKSDTSASAIDLKSDTSGSAIDLKSETSGSAIDLTSDTTGSAIDLKSDTPGSIIDLTSDTSGSAIDLKSDTSGSRCGTFRSAIDLTSDTPGSIIDLTSDTSGSAIDLKSDTSGSAIDLKSDSSGSWCGTYRSAIDLTSDTTGSALDLKSDTFGSAIDLKSDTSGSRCGTYRSAIDLTSDTTGSAIDLKSDTTESSINLTLSTSGRHISVLSSRCRKDVTLSYTKEASNERPPCRRNQATILTILSRYQDSREMAKPYIEARARDSSSPSAVELSKAKHPQLKMEGVCQHKRKTAESENPHSNTPAKKRPGKCHSVNPWTRKYIREDGERSFTSGDLCCGQSLEPPPAPRKDPSRAATGRRAIGQGGGGASPPVSSGGKSDAAAAREELELGSPVGLEHDESCETDLDLFSIDPEICTDTRTARSTIDLTSDTCGYAIDLTSDTSGSALDLTSDTSGSALDLKSDTSGSAIDLKSDTSGSRCGTYRSAIDLTSDTTGSAIDLKSDTTESSINLKLGTSGRHISVLSSRCRKDVTLSNTKEASNERPPCRRNPATILTILSRYQDSREMTKPCIEARARDSNTPSAVELLQAKHPQLKMEGVCQHKRKTAESENPHGNTPAKKRPGKCHSVNPWTRKYSLTSGDLCCGQSLEPPPAPRKDPSRAATARRAIGQGGGGASPQVSSGGKSDGAAVAVACRVRRSLFV